MKKRGIGLGTIIIVILILAIIFVINVVRANNRKYEISEVKEYKYFVVNDNGKYGVINTSGDKIIDTKYDDVKIINPEKAVFVCYEEGKSKVLNEKSEEIYTKYESIQPLQLKGVMSDLMYEKSVLKYSKDGKYGIISIDGKKITNPIYDEIDTLQYKEGELLVKKNNKYGVINIKGTTLIKIKYDSVNCDKYYDEENGYKYSGYIVSKTTDEGYRYGYINYNGKQLLKINYNDLFRITDIDSKDSYIICAKNGQYGMTKNKKKIINNEYQALSYNDSNSTITALRGKKYGVISIKGDTIVPFEYEQIDTSGEYIYATTEDNKIKTFDKDGKEANIDANLSIIDVENTKYQIYINTADNQTRYVIYKDGKAITKNEYVYAEYLFDNYFIVCNLDGKLGVIDENEVTKIPFSYNSIQKVDGTDLIQTYQNDSKTISIYNKSMRKVTELSDSEAENVTKYDGYVKIYNDNDVKYVLNDGKEVKNTELFANNKIFANKWNGKWGFVDKNGNKVVDYVYDKVTEVNKYGYAGIEKDGKWGVVDQNGQIILEPKFEINDINPIFIKGYYQTENENGEIYFTNV